MADSEKASVSVPAVQYTSTPPFDPEKYRCYLEDTELSEDQQIEYLKVLWSIMTTFVELGFGVDSIQLLEAKDSHATRAETTGEEIGSHLLPGVACEAKK